MSTLSRLRVYPLFMESGVEWEWVSLGERNQVLLRGTTQDLPSHQRLEVVLPGEWFAAHRLVIPITGRRYLESIIRQTLEDRLLGRLEESLIAMGAQEGQGQWVWVCDKARVDTLLSSLRDAGWTPAQVYPIFELLPGIGTARTPTGYIFRSASNDYGFIDDFSQLTDLFPDLPPACDDLLASPCCPDSDLLGGLAARKKIPLNYLALRRPIFLAGMLAFVFLLSLIVRWQGLLRHEARLQQEIRHIFAATFPGTPIVDPILQWQTLRPPNSKTSTDVLDRLQNLAMDIGRPIHPQQIEINRSVIRLTLSESEFSRVKPLLEEKKVRFDSLPQTENGLVTVRIQLDLDKPNRKA